MIKLFLLFALVTVAKSQTTPVEQCVVSQGPLPINAYIDGCTSLPCLLYQQENSFVNIIFKADRTMRSMRTVAIAYVSFGPVVVPVPYPLGADAVTCNFLTNTYCPVLQGEVVMYTLTMAIEEFMTVGTTANVEFRIMDEDNLPVTCIRVPIRIIAPRLTQEKHIA